MSTHTRSTTTGFGGLGRTENQSQQVTRLDHHLDLDPLPIPGITCETATVSFVHGVSTLRTMESQHQPLYRPTALGLLRLRRRRSTEDADPLTVAHAALPQKVQAKPQQLSLTASPIFRAHVMVWYSSNEPPTSAGEGPRFQPLSFLWRKVNSALLFSGTTRNIPSTTSLSPQ